MNRRLLLVILAVGGILLAGVISVMELSAPSAPPDTSGAKPAPASNAPTAPKSAAEVLLEREPERPSLPPRPRTTKAAPAVADAPAPAADPVTARLHIDSDVPGAQVFLDRVFIGTTPVTAEGVKPGEHRLNVAAEGYDGIVQTLDITPGERTFVAKFREVWLQASIEVVHKHRLGSCKGRLVATAQGLRYETANTDDTFSVPLTALEVFQVDYLEKNLKVKLPKGKQYNFTDPQEGNADRLFVFHRDVEKARERLKKGDVPAR